jgi:hypothetical protein
MDEDQNKSEEERFEDGLRQILKSAPSDGRGADSHPGPRPRASYTNLSETLGEAGKEPKMLIVFKVLKLLAPLAVVAFMAMFVHNIISPK